MKTLRITLKENSLTIDYLDQEVEKRKYSKELALLHELILENIGIKIQGTFGCSILFMKNTCKLAVNGSASQLYEVLVWMSENLDGATGKITIEDDPEVEQLIKSVTEK